MKSISHHLQKWINVSHCTSYYWTQKQPKNIGNIISIIKHNPIIRFSNPFGLELLYLSNTIRISHPLELKHLNLNNNLENKARTLIRSIGSSFIAFIVSVAPKILAFCSFSSWTSTAIISEAPNALAICKQLEHFSGYDYATVNPIKMH